MKIVPIDGSKERKVLISMIVNPVVLGRVVPKWTGDLFRSRYANVIGGLCVDHWKKHGTAPKRGIEPLFADWADQVRDDAVVKGGSDFLGSLDSEYRLNGEINPGLMVDMAGDLFNRVRSGRLAEDIQANLDVGKVDKALQSIEQFRKVEMGAGAGIDFLSSKQDFLSAFDDKGRGECLVKYPGALGRFFANTFERETFTAFVGPQKSGKSWWLLDAAHVAVSQRRRTAFFEVGDFSEAELKELIAVKMARHPFRSDNGRWPVVARWPVGIAAPPKGDPKGIADVKWRDREFKAPLDAAKAWEAARRFREDVLKSKKSYFRMSVHPNLSVSILGIRSILEQWAQEGWSADVVVIDYADNLNPVDKREEPRDRVNTTWKLMSAMRQELHCCLITASQVNVKGFRQHWLDRGNFSEDNRKLSHVSAMVGINVSDDEKERDQCRLNYLVKRRGKFSSRRGVHVAGCLALACPAVLSTF